MSFSRYRSYKPSGFEWLGEIPHHWTAARLKVAIQRMSSGTSVNSTDRPAEPGEFGVLKTSCVYTGEFRPEENKAVVPEEVDRVTCPVLRGALIVSRMNTPDLVGSAGFVNSAHDNIFLPDRLWQVEINKGVADAKFIYYWMCSAIYRANVQIACDGTSSSMQNLDQRSFRSFPLPCPPLPEQLAISRFLDSETAKTDALIAEQERLVELLKEKRQAIISWSVTTGLSRAVKLQQTGEEWIGTVPTHWRTTRLKYITDAIVDCPHETPIYDAEGDFLVIRTADIDRGTMNTSQMYRLAEEQYRLRTRRQTLRAKDIVYGREGERWGHAALVPDDDRFCLGQRMMQFRAGADIEPEYLMWHLNAWSTIHQGEVDTVGSTSPHVNVSTIRNFVLALPSKKEQREIAEHIREATGTHDELIAKCEETALMLAERRSALISAAVTGQIDVRALAEQKAA